MTTSCRAVRARRNFEKAGGTRLLNLVLLALPKRHRRILIGHHTHLPLTAGIG